MVSQRATGRIVYADTLAWVTRTGNNGLREELQAVGPPPLAALGLITASLPGAAMAFNSVFVVSNRLRPRRFEPSASARS